jgi:hypothetical protein
MFFNAMIAIFIRIFSVFCSPWRFTQQGKELTFRLKENIQPLLNEVPLRPKKII